MTTSLGRRSRFGIDCVRCRNDLIAPERSEYCSHGVVRHVWHCCECGCRFESVVSLVVLHSDAMKPHAPEVA